MRKKALAALALSVIVFVVAGGFYVKFRSKVLLNNFSFPQAEINGEKITPEKEEITACRRPWVPDFAKSLLSAEYRAVYDKEQRDSVTAPGGKVQINYDGNYSAHVKGENFSAEPDREGMLYLPQPGEYTLEMKAISEDKKIQGTAEFRAIIEVPKTAVVFSDTSPLQGALVRVYVKGLFPESEITVDSPVFSSSGISYNREEMSAFFYIPITYYRRSGEYPIKVFSDGQEVGQTTLNVKKYDFSVVSFDVDRETTASTVGSRTANSEYRQKIHPLYMTKDESVYWDGVMTKPVEEDHISSEFGEIRYINGSTVPERHSGIDYAAPAGTPVCAPAKGKVEFSGFLQLSGNTVVIDHGLGLKSYFFHMDDTSCRVGDIVETGNLIGHVGSTGYSTGPHLHFQVSIENHPVNPEFLYRQ